MIKEKPTVIPGIFRYISLILGMSHPLGYGFCAVSVSKQLENLPPLGLESGRELWECMNVFVISILNE